MRSICPRSRTSNGLRPSKASFGVWNHCGMNSGFITRANPSRNLRNSSGELTTDLFFMNRLFISIDSMRHPTDPRIFVEVVIKGKGMADVEPFHDDKAYTV